MEIKNKRIIVTGGAGFIGSNLVERLCKDNEVCAVDNLYTGSQSNLSAAMKSGSVTFKKADSGDLSKLGFDADIVYHLGMYSASPMYRENPKLLGEVTNSMVKILEYVKGAGIPMVFASTSSIYNGVKPPHREDADYGITDYYTEGRIFAERASELYNKMEGCNIAAMRFFSVYGPHEEAKKGYANLVSQFMWLMKKDKSPVIYGDGTQKRDFVHVYDVVDALVSASKVRGFEVFNVGYGKSYMINQMVETLNRKLGKRITPTYIKMPVKNYVMATLADTGKAKRMLGFKAKIGLEQGISMLI
ncbi:MAG: NAD-dependent epimerase/dehydratase family protein [Candidatus Micrarchaeaceae archaeon]